MDVTHIGNCFAQSIDSNVKLILKYPCRHTKNNFDQISSYPGASQVNKLNEPSHMSLGNIAGTARQSVREIKEGRPLLSGNIGEWITGKGSLVQMAETLDVTTENTCS